MDKELHPGCIFITGVSGVGKSTVLKGLAAKGYPVVDTDYGLWKTKTEANGQEDYIWNEEKVARLLETHTSGTLFISGCVSNQGRFYRFFQEIVVLTAPVETILQRIRTRDNNPYGKGAGEEQAILQSIEEIQPLLLSRATKIIDTSKPLDEVVGEIEELIYTQER